MKNDMVIVRSKTVNNEAVPVVLQLIEPFTGEPEVREITRTVIFKNFQSIMSLAWAKTLVKSNPKEYTIVEADEKGELKVVETLKCEFCETVAKTKAGLSAHVRISHPDKWEGKK